MLSSVDSMSDCLMCDADTGRYEGEARPEPVYEETEEDQQRKRFVPNYNYKPYARQY